jgi:hypothetical protein
MNYRIVGADGKVYGPVTLEQLRQWFAQGRVEARTPVHVAGASAWTTLGQLPELAAQPAASPATSPPLAAPIPPIPRGTNRFATAGLVCALLAWTCCCCLPFNLLGLVFSIIALVQINAQPEPQGGRTFAIIGLVLSAANLLFALVLGVMQVAFGSFNWQFQ